MVHRWKPLNVSPFPDLTGAQCQVDNAGARHHLLFDPEHCHERGFHRPPVNFHPMVEEVSCTPGERCWTWTGAADMLKIRIRESQSSWLTSRGRFTKFSRELCVIEK